MLLTKLVRLTEMFEECNDFPRYLQGMIIKEKEEKTHTKLYNFRCGLGTNCLSAIPLNPILSIILQKFAISTFQTKCCMLASMPTFQHIRDYDYRRYWTFLPYREVILGKIHRSLKISLFGHNFGKTLPI